jgi:hypothetical protein
VERWVGRDKNPSRYLRCDGKGRTMRDAGRTPQEVILIALGIFATVAVLLYWAAWFMVPGVVQSRTPSAPDHAIYVAFEQSFPLADSWLAIASIVGVIGLIRRRTWGFLFMLLAGGEAIFLGLMDLLYDLEHRMFVPLTQESVVELVIVVLLLLLGPVVVGLTWSQRRRLLGPEQAT